MTTKPSIKRTIRNPEKFVGKYVDSTKWNIPNGYARCCVTGKMYPESELEYSLDHWAFDKRWLVERGIYYEDAEYMSAEGWYHVERVLEREGVRELYGRIVSGDLPGVLIGTPEADALLDEPSEPDPITVERAAETARLETGFLRALAELPASPKPFIQLELIPDTRASQLELIPASVQ